MDQVEYAGRIYNCESVIERLQSQITPDRLQKMDQVLERRSQHLVTVFENIYDQGNCRAALRSAEAFGYHRAHHIISIAQSKESRRVSMGAEKWMWQTKWPSTNSCIQNLKDQGYKIYVTHLEGAKSIYECDFKEPVALCFGGERKGVSQELREQADQLVYLPMRGFVESYNISVAAALCYQHIYFEHCRHFTTPPPLPLTERSYLQALYLLRSFGHPPDFNIR